MSLCSCNNKKEDNIYDYSTPDITMTECLLDIKTIQQTSPEVKEVVKSNEYIKGYLMNSIPNKLGNGNFFFWLGIPSTQMPEGGYPAVLLIHGGGGNAFADWVEIWNKKGYVALAIDISGQMFDSNFNLVKNTSFLANGSWGSVGCQYDQDAFRSSWTGVNITNCILANNYLRSLNNVNKDKIVCTGISWGGYTTCILSGLDKRFVAFAPVYGCGFLYQDSWGLNTAGLSGLDVASRANWAAIYDPSAYLPYSTKPMLFVAGMDDHAFSSVSRALSTELIPGKHFYCYSTALAHGHYFNLTPCIELFFERVFNSIKYDENIKSITLKDNKITIEALDNLTIDLSITTSTSEDSHTWEWTFEEKKLTKGTNTFDIDSNVTAALVSVYGEKSTPDYSSNLLMNKDINLFK